jgi:hypothetical protein
MLQGETSLLRFPSKAVEVFYITSPSNPTMAPSSTQLLTEKVPEILLREKDGWRVRLTTSPPSMSPLSAKCVSPDVSQLCRPPRPIRGIAHFIIHQ